jgi:hypothetical protein
MGLCQLINLETIAHSGCAFSEKLYLPFGPQNLPVSSTQKLSLHKNKNKLGTTNAFF